MKKNHFNTDGLNDVYILTNEQMKSAEQSGMSKGIPSIVLMENAAYNITRQVIGIKGKKVLVLAGKGNNGGDGLAAARQLLTAGIDTDVIFVGDCNRATPDCKTNHDILKGFCQNMVYISKTDDIPNLKRLIEKCDTIIDALIGTGLTRRLSDMYAEIVNAVNASGKTVIAVDCPTGISSGTGEDYGIAVDADITVTFHCPKTGMLLYPAFSHVGELFVGNIGMPYGSENTSGFVLTKKTRKQAYAKKNR